MKYPILLTLIVTVKVLRAFPNGAGQCLIGQAAVGGSHLNAGSVTTGLLEDAGFTMRGLATTVPHENLFTVGNAVGNTIELGVVGTTSGFRGVLIQVTGAPGGDSIVQPGKFAPP